MTTKIRVILKCGKEFTMECEDVTVKYSKATGECVDFRYTGCTKNRPVYLDMTQIAAVIQEEV